MDGQLNTRRARQADRSSAGRAGSKAMKGCAGACTFCTAFFFWPGHARHGRWRSNGDVCGNDGDEVRGAPSDERGPRHRLRGRPVGALPQPPVIDTSPTSPSAVPPAPPATFLPSTCAVKARRLIKSNPAGSAPTSPAPPPSASPIRRGGLAVQVSQGTPPGRRHRPPHRTGPHPLRPRPHADRLAPRVAGRARLTTHGGLPPPRFYYLTNAAGTVRTS